MFRKAYRLPFTLLGIPVQLDVTFLVILPIFAFSIGQKVGFWAEQVGVEDHAALHHAWMSYLLGFVTALGLFASVLIHELGHAVVARLYGVKVRNITLWLLGGVATFDEMPRQRGAEAVVAIVGPVVSVLVGAVCWLALVSLPPSAVPARFVFTYLATMNIALAVFNMLPALPLDGGRVLRSLLALRMSHLRATQVAGGVSKFLAILLGLWGLWTFQMMLVLVAFFVYMAVNGELRASLVAELLDGVRVADLMGPPPAAVPADLTAGELAQAMLLGREGGFVVVRDGQVVGMVCLEDVQGRAVPPAATVADVMRPKVHVVRADAPAIDAMQRMSRNGYPRLLAVDESGQVVGMISNAGILRAIETRTMGLQWGVNDGEPLPPPRVRESVRAPAGRYDMPAA